ncbi:Hypothetical predicted protein, partial [Paramuricea clavata]
EIRQSYPVLDKLEEAYQKISQEICAFKKQCCYENMETPFSKCLDWNHVYEEKQPIQLGDLDTRKKLTMLQGLDWRENVLERAVICLKENGRQADLEAGTLYTIVLEKIPEKLLSQYYRWLREKQKEESMETLKDWISQEAEYQIQASEIKHGFRKIRAERVDGSGSGSGRGGRTFYGKPVDGGDKRVKKCQVCTEIHPIWKCTKYRDQSIEDKWKMAKKLGQGIPL